MGAAIRTGHTAGEGGGGGGKGGQAGLDYHHAGKGGVRHKRTGLQTGGREGFERLEAG